MSLPLAPYPPPSVRATFPADQWTAVLHSWSTALTHLLQLPDSKFALSTITDPLVTFITSFLLESPVPTPADTPTLTLRKKSFQLIHRLLSLSHLPRNLLTPTFLISYIRTYGKTPAATQLIDTVWQRHEIAFSELLAKLKGDACSQIRRHAATGEFVEQLGRIFAAYPKIAAMFLAGDEFADAVMEAGDEGVAKLLGRALLEGGKVNWTVVVECLYTLTTSPGEDAKRLLVRLAGYGVGQRLKTAAEESGAPARVAGVAEKLQGYAPVRKRKPVAGKGKGKMPVAEVNTFMHEGEVEMESKVASIRDLFPQLGAGFVRRCLESLGGDVEVVTSALLEDNLPASLAGANREEEQYRPAAPSRASAIPERRNVFDNDELDLLAPESRARLTVGRKNITADTLLDNRDISKESILSALAAIDLDDDERDDTYDEADVGASLEATTESTTAAANEDDERKAWAAYKSSPGNFARDQRGSNARKQLKDETGWTDEALEGFAIMIGREPERARRLDRKWDQTQMPGQSVVIQRSRWQEGDEDGGRGRGRGRGGFRGRGRGGPPPGTQGGQGAPTAPGGDGRGRARNNQNKGRVANHNRRDQRAKKVARGGFGPGPE